MDEYDLVRKLRLGANLVLEPQRSVNQLYDEFTDMYKITRFWMRKVS